VYRIGWLRRFDNVTSVRQGASRGHRADVSRKVQVIHPSGRQLQEIMQWYLRTERSLARDNFADAGLSKKQNKQKKTTHRWFSESLASQFSRINYFDDFDVGMSYLRSYYLRSYVIFSHECRLLTAFRHF